MRRLFLSMALAIALSAGSALPLAGIAPALAQSAGKGASGLPLPRFVSLKAKRVNLRIGPGRDYAVSWLYTRAGVPMEVIQEYDNWRRVRDAEGTEGWVYQSLLSGERTAMTAPWKRVGQAATLIPLHREARANSDILARLEPGVIITMSECNGQWCQAEAQGVKGWIQQAEVWGAYPGEAFKN